MGLSRTIRRLALRFKPEGTRALGLHAQLEGQLAIEETHFLLTRAAGARTIVEIGSYRGKSCAALALGSAPHGRVTAIDPHLSCEGAGTTGYNAEDEAVFHRTMLRMGVADRVTHIVKTSHEARAGWPDDQPIDFLWIDGDHSYEGLRTDLNDWAELVAPGGLLAGHDYKHREGVRRAWHEYFDGRPGWSKPRFVRSIAWTQRLPG
jgi:predicted O-methyltransferase YrrM